MTIQKEILFEVRDPDSKQVIIYAERVMGQVRVHSLYRDKGKIDLGAISDVWRENDDAQAELRHIRDLLKLPKNIDLPKTISAMIKKINELAMLIGKEEQ